MPLFVRLPDLRRALRTDCSEPAPHNFFLTPFFVPRCLFLPSLSCQRAPVPSPSGAAPTPPPCFFVAGTCPSGTAIWSKASSANTAHASVECGNAGHCDRRSGTCKCFKGFVGVACHRVECPSQCNGHGYCKTIESLAYDLGPDTDAGIAGDGNGPVYTNWDKDTMLGCVCDPGWTGASCTFKFCPRGDDPETTGQAARQIILTTGATSGTLAGTLRLTFDGYTTTLSADAANADDTVCASAFGALENIGT